MPRKARVVERGLLRKGFRLADTHHRRFVYHTVDGEEPQPVTTIMSHGADRDISDRLLGMMARQLHLTRRQFDDLIDCRLSQAEYEAMQRRGGFIR